MITKSQLDEMLKNKHVTVDGLPKRLQRTIDRRQNYEYLKKQDELQALKALQVLKFTVPGIPVSCPRMTQRDKWMKRPCVMRYREYSDRLRKFINLNDMYVGKITMKFYMPMPESWSVKKIQLMAGRPHRVKPDRNNLEKGVEDALLKNDSMVWWSQAEKYWAQPGQERTELTFEA